MNLVHDYIHPTPGNPGGQCRIRLYLPEEKQDSPVVICTEPAEGNAGMSVTNAAAQLAAEVIASNELTPPLTWIEHYENAARGSSEDPASAVSVPQAGSRSGFRDDTFDLVTFGPYRVRGNHQGEPPRVVSVGEPSWKPLDRQTVQILIGEELES